MITPQDIQEKGFVKAVFGGYDMTEVDNFLEELTADYTALYKENAILKSKLKVLVEKVEEYRSTEDAMRMALLTAQKMGEDMVAKAKAESEDMLSQTEKEARTRKSELDKELADEAERVNAAKKATAAFVAASQELCRKQMEFLERLNTVKAPEPLDTAAAEPTEEERITDTAKAIDESVSRILEEKPKTSELETEEQKSEAPQADGSDEPTLIFRKSSGVDWDEDDEPTSPRPRFNFENLQFGDNYSTDKK